MKRLSKAFLIFTSILYTAFLLYVYAYFAEQPAIYLQLSENTISFTNNTLFYIGVLIPMLLALLGVLFSSIIRKQPVGKSAFFKSEDSKMKLSSWSIGTGGVVNLFCAALLSVVLFSNNEEGLTQNGFLPFIVLGILFILIWILWLPLILINNK